MSSVERAGIALVICAPSGTGKTTLIKGLIAKYPRFAFSVSCTTREPRPDERAGVDYDFISADEFLRRRDAGYFAEWAEVHGNFYGTPLEGARRLLRQGHDVLFDIDVQGALQLRDTLPGACFIFIFPPSRAELEHRLLTRGTETERTLARRLAAAEQELAEANWFSVWIVNDDLERASKELDAAYVAATLSPLCRKNFFQRLLQEWRNDGDAV